MLEQISSPEHPGAPVEWPWRGRLRLPLISAPMLHVSGPALVMAACRAGVVGAFPTLNARSSEELDAWLATIAAELEESGTKAPPFCPNLVIASPRMADDLRCLVKRKVEMVITSVGSPKSAIGPLHDIGATVLADVATLAHAEKAIAVGADGLVLLTAGAGGQTGWLNPFAFCRAVRKIFDGPVVMAGGILDGHALRAAQLLGCDLAYMGTRFIATRESMASDGYREMLVDSTMDDIMLTRAITGLGGNFLRPSIVAAGHDPDGLDESIGFEAAQAARAAEPEGRRRWRDVWSAGHSVSGVTKVQTVEELVDEIEADYVRARGREAS